MLLLIHHTGPCIHKDEIPACTHGILYHKSDISHLCIRDVTMLRIIRERFLQFHEMLRRMLRARTRTIQPWEEIIE